MALGLEIISTAFATVLAMAKAGSELLPETMRSTVVHFPKKCTGWDQVPDVRFRRYDTEFEHRSLDTPLTTGRQFKRLSAIVNDAIGSAERAVRMQASAYQQLELAQYGLSTLSAELSSVMKLPARSEPAVRLMGDGDSRLSTQFDDAIAA